MKNTLLGALGTITVVSSLSLFGAGGSLASQAAVSISHPPTVSSVAPLSKSGATTTSSSTTTSTSSTTTTVASGTTTTTEPVTTTTTIPDPFTWAPLSTYLKTRSSNVTVGFYDVTTGQTYLYRDGVRMLTASMVKIDILADLLYRAQVAKRSLTASEKNLATSMVEDSDNNAAQSLWEDIGQLPAIASFNKQMGYQETIPDWGWGNMNTTPSDELRLLKTILFPNKILTASSQAYEQGLMEHVVSYQRFGIPYGVPSGALVGNKNGWYPEAGTGWQVNSAGFVKKGDTYYLAVVMTGSNPDETYGIDTVDRVGSLLWQFASTHS